MKIKYTSKDIYKYKEINSNTIDGLKNHYHYYSDVSKLNDPFDSRARIKVSKSKKIIKNWLEMHEGKSDPEEIKYLQKNGKKIFSNGLETNHLIRILSLTDVPDNNLMWGHYANSHHGICLIFHSLKYNFRRYIHILPCQFKTSNHLIRAGLMEVKKVTYSRHPERPYDFMRGKDSDISRFAFTKHINWKYEKESRSIFYDNEIEKKIYYPKRALKGIIFGANTKFPERKQIIDATDQTFENFGIELEFYLASVDYFDYKIKIKRVNKEVLLNQS